MRKQLHYGARHAARVAPVQRNERIALSTLALPEPHPRGDEPELDLSQLMENFARFIGSDRALYCRLGGRGQPPEVICSWAKGAVAEDLGRPRIGGFLGRALLSTLERAAFEPLDPGLDAALVAPVAGLDQTYAVSAPVRLATGATGALIASFSGPPPDRDLATWAAESSAAMLGMCVYQPEAIARLLGAPTDSLTGCLNWDSTCRELAQEINRADRGRLGLSCCFLDLDGFKQVNDRYGHVRGNEVLIEVARTLRRAVRSCDTIGRFGGDEFLAILPQTDEAEAWMLADRLRSLISATRIPGLESPLGVSIGLSQWRAGTTAEQLIEQADQALMRAKARGGGITEAVSSAAGADPSRLHGTADRANA